MPPEPLSRADLREELGPFGRAVVALKTSVDALVGRQDRGEEEQRRTNERLLAIETELKNAIAPVTKAQAEEHAEAAAWRASMRERPFAWASAAVVALVVVMLVARGDVALLLPVVTRLMGGTECPPVATGAP